MAANSSIEWTEATWNPVAGCTPISPGCLNCYAAAMSHRLEAMGQKKYTGLTVLHNDIRTFNGKINLVPEALSIPMKRKKPTIYFVNSMSDLFHEDVPNDFVDQVFAVMALTKRHTYQVLTKRPDRMAEYLAGLTTTSGPDPDRWDAARRPMWEKASGTQREYIGVAGAYPTWPLPNVWLGCSPVNQKTCDEYIPHLLRTPAAVRFLSLEPLLGPIDLNRDLGGTRWIGGQRGCGATHRGDGSPGCPREPHHHHDSRCGPGLDWTIVGGESGPGARPCVLGWIKDIVRQCQLADVPVFVKQVGSNPTNREGVAHQIHDKKGGEPSEWPEDIRIRQMPKAAS